MLKRSVPGFFSRSRKAAPWELSAFKVVADAFAANTFAWAGLIAAIAGCKVFFFLALHGQLLLNHNWLFRMKSDRKINLDIALVFIMKLRIDQKSFME